MPQYRRKCTFLRLLTTSTTLTCATFPIYIQWYPNFISLFLKSVRSLDWRLIECKFTSSKMCNCCSTSLHCDLKEMETWQMKKGKDLLFTSMPTHFHAEELLLCAINKLPRLSSNLVVIFVYLVNSSMDNMNFHPISSLVANMPSTTT